MSQPTLTRETYIRATAAQVWQALTDPELTARYAFGRVQSTWHPGEAIVYLAPDGTTRVLEGTLLEVEPRRRLVLLCRFLGDPQLAADRPHRETFAIEELGGICRLTATFDQYAPDSAAYRACAHGMAVTGSSLKSLLESRYSRPARRSPFPPPAETMPCPLSCLRGRGCGAARWAKGRADGPHLGQRCCRNVSPDVLAGRVVRCSMTSRSRRRWSTG